MSLANIKTKVTESTSVGKIENFLDENGPTLSLFGSFIMLGITIYSAFKASEKVAEIKKDYEEKVKQIEDEPLPEIPEGVGIEEGSDVAKDFDAERNAAIKDKQRRIKELKTYRNVLYILAYKWVMAGGSLTALLMFLCNYLKGSKLAAATAMIALQEDKIRKGMQSAKELLPDDKVTELENKTLEKLISRNFTDENGEPVIIRPDTKTPGVKDIYVDKTFGTQFQFKGTEKDLQEIFDRATDYCYRCHGLPVAKFYTMLGIPTPPWAWGTWGPNRPFKAHIEKRELCGAIFKTIVYDYDPGTLAEAGCPNR